MAKAQEKIKCPICQQLVGANAVKQHQMVNTNCLAIQAQLDNAKNSANNINSTPNADDSVASTSQGSEKPVQKTVKEGLPSWQQASILQVKLRKDIDAEPRFVTKKKYDYWRTLGAELVTKDEIDGIVPGAIDGDGMIVKRGMILVKFSRPLLAARKRFMDSKQVSHAELEKQYKSKMGGQGTGSIDVSRS